MYMCVTFKLDLGGIFLFPFFIIDFLVSYERGINPSNRNNNSYIIKPLKQYSKFQITLTTVNYGTVTS